MASRASSLVRITGLSIVEADALCFYDTSVAEFVSQAIYISR